MGAPGPALALLVAGLRMTDRRYLDAARRVLDGWSSYAVALCAEMASLPGSRELGVSSGLGGMAWALDVAQLLRPGECWGDGADSLWNLITRNVEAAGQGALPLDHLDGLAGLTMAARVRGRDDGIHRRLHRRLVQELADPANPHRVGLQSYSGAAHGIAGALDAVVGGPNGGSDETALVTQHLWVDLENFFDSSARAWWYSKIALAVTLPDVDVSKLIQAQRRASTENLEKYTRGRREADPDDLAWQLVIESLIHAADAEVRWLDHCRRVLVE